MVTADIYNYLPIVYHFVFVFAVNKHLSCWSWFFGEVSQTFILEGSGILAALPEVGCCNFLLTFIIGHGSIKRDS